MKRGETIPFAILWEDPIIWAAAILILLASALK